MSLNDLDDGFRKIKGAGYLGTYDSMFDFVGLCPSYVMKKRANCDEVDIYGVSVTSYFLGYSGSEVGDGFTVFNNIGCAAGFS